MAAESAAPGKLESIQTAINTVRDGLILVLFLMLLLLPGVMNRILTGAGITQASLFGFDWKAQLDKATAQTEAAQQETVRLSVQLSTYANQMDEVAQAATDPGVRSRARTLAMNIRSSQTDAARLGQNLGRSVVQQRELRTQFTQRLRGSTQ